jgi:probable rRNA maturation factor
MSRQFEVTNSEPALTIDPDSIERWLAHMDEACGYDIPEGSLGIAFVDVETCCRLHSDFFNDPTQTDVMTFPGDLKDNHAGDIAICPSVAAECRIEENTTFREELSLYLVHAWLHLAGLDDKDSCSVKEIRGAESIVMKQLKEKSLLLDVDWTNSE